MRARACVALICLTMAHTSIVSRSAEAQKDNVTETARKRFQEGVKYFDAHKYEEARAAFLQAYALKRHPAILLNLAQSELRSNHPLEATQHFSAFLHDSTTASAAERSDAEKGLITAREKIGRLQVQVNADGAEIFVDGDRVGQSPLADPVDVAPSAHTVEARFGGKSVTSSATATAGKITPVSLTVERPVEPVPVAAAPPPPPAASATPVESAATPPPAADANVSTEGREPFFTWLTGHPVGWATAGVTVVGAGLGLTFYAMAQSVEDKVNSDADQIRADYACAANAQCWRNLTGGQPVPADLQQKINTGSPVCVGPPDRYRNACSTLQSNLDDEHSDRTVATVGFVAAGVGIASMVTAYFLTSGKTGGDSAGPTAVVMPVYGPHQAGLSVLGSF